MAVIKNSHTTNDNWYIDFRFEGIRYRRKSPENSKRGAEAFERQVLHKLSQGINPFKKKKEKKVYTFEEFAWKWMDVYVKNHNKISGVKGKTSILRRHLLPFFGKKKLNEIKNLDIEEFKVIDKEKGLCNKTVNEHITVLNTCLKHAVEWEELDKKPKIKLLKVPPQKYDFLSFEESELLLKKAEGQTREMILFALKTGLRYGEIRAVSWSDINWETNVISVNKAFYRSILGTTKGNKERFVPMDYEIREMLKSRKKSKGYIFADKKGKFLEENFARRALKKTVDELDLQNKGKRKIGWQALRHSFSSHLAMKGASIAVIQKLLGHSDIKTTMRYAHLLPSTLNEAIKLLGKDGQYMDSEKQKQEQFVGIMKSFGVQFETNIKTKTEPKDSVSNGGDGGS